MSKKINLSLLILLSLFLTTTWAQNNSLDAYNLSYNTPKKYEIGGVTITGAQYFDHNALKSITGLNVGKEISIPGDEITDAIKRLWRQKLFSNIKISIDRIEGKYVYLNIEVDRKSVV